MTVRPSGTVTFLFTDVEGSTRLWEEHPEGMKDALARHDAIVRDCVAREEGLVFTTAGDQFCAAFSSPNSALDAAVSIQRRLAAETWGDTGPLRVRMAIHTGNAEERDGDYFGPTLNRCARLLSIGHGGQILVSAVTAQLLVAAGLAPHGLEDLGSHDLKDLDRAEHVFQVVHPDLESDFPDLNSSGGRQDAADLLEQGRQAHAKQQWSAAFESLSEANETIDLTSGDLQRLGEAAFWSGHAAEAVVFKEQAYGRLVREDSPQAAAMVALELADLYKYRLAAAVSRAWVSRAEALVGDAVDTEAHGYLLRTKSVNAFEADGDPETAVALADEVIVCGRALGNRSIEALGLMDKGRFLVSLGRIDEGMSLVDESMVAAVAGELDPNATGRNYCNMLSVCDQVADYQRAAEWSDAAEAWCKQHSDSAYPGICRIFRAELKWLHGDWDAAAEDLRRAVDELTGFTPIIGAALYQIGLVRLRSEDREAAADLFRTALEHGFTPLPGLASLRLLEGDAAAAEELLLDAIVGNAQPLDRAKYLPTLIDAEVELGNLSEAHTFLRELEATAELCDSAAMRAEAADRRAAVARAEDRADEAVADLQYSISAWTRLQMPYEAAQSRLQLAEVHRLLGNGSAATMEDDAAQSTLDRLRTRSSGPAT